MEHRLGTLMGLVIPLFGRNLKQGMPHTHFIVLDGVSLCGQAVDGRLVTENTTPECLTCKDVWARATGWSFPLPAIGCVDGAE